MAKYVENFNEWAMEWCRKSRADVNARIVFSPETPIVFALDLKTGKSASAKCHPTEKFINEIGIGVAYARLKGEEIPIERKMVKIGTLKSNETFFIEHNGFPTKGIIVGQDKRYNNTIWRYYSEETYIVSKANAKAYKV